MLRTSGPRARLNTGCCDDRRHERDKRTGRGADDRGVDGSADSERRSAPRPCSRRRARPRPPPGRCQLRASGLARAREGRPRPAPTPAAGAKAPLENRGPSTSWTATCSDLSRSRLTATAAGAPDTQPCRPAATASTSQHQPIAPSAARRQAVPPARRAPATRRPARSSPAREPRRQRPQRPRRREAVRPARGPRSGSRARRPGAALRRRRSPSAAVTASQPTRGSTVTSAAASSAAITGAAGEDANRCAEIQPVANALATPAIARAGQGYAGLACHGYGKPARSGTRGSSLTGSAACAAGAFVSGRGRSKRTGGGCRSGAERSDLARHGAATTPGRSSRRSRDPLRASRSSSTVPRSRGRGAARGRFPRPARGADRGAGGAAGGRYAPSRRARCAAVPVRTG